MSDAIESKLAENLDRWRESGRPQQWCDAHHGQWDHEEWLRLLSSLWWSEFWPMDPAAVLAVLVELKKPWTVRRWKESGEALRWVEAHDGAWDHDAWLGLLASLKHSPYWPMDPEAVGATLEQTRREWQNLRRWQESGRPRQWVEARHACWDHADWLALLDSLRQSEYWPLEPAEVGRLLEAHKRHYLNLQRWQATGQPRQWVQERQGQWGEDEWQGLLANLQASEYWPLDPADVADVLEGWRREWWNLRRWRDAGLARRWVEVRHGVWNHDDWLTLLASLQSSDYWPVDPAALGRVLEETREQWRSLQRWQASGQPRQWLAAHPGRWRDEELRVMLDSLWRAEFGPLDPRAVQNVLEEMERARENLRRWRHSGEAARWVAAHPDGWNHADWLALLDDLRQSEYWPLPPDEVGAALEQLKGQLAAPRPFPAGDDAPAVFRLAPERRAA